MPGIADIPPIDVYFDEGGFDHVLGGSVGIGEVATVPTVGRDRQRHPQRDRRAGRIEIPIRPDRLIDLLHRRTAA